QHGGQTLAEQLDAPAARLDAATASMSDRRRKAFDLLLSAKAREAFDLSKEPPTLRDRYGRNLFGSSVLLARRLVEAGVTFVTVHAEAQPNGHWHTLDSNFTI